MKTITLPCGRHLGSFVSAEEAARAFDREAVALYGEFARLNFPAQMEVV